MIPPFVETASAPDNTKSTFSSSGAILESVITFVLIPLLSNSRANADLHTL